MVLLVGIACAALQLAVVGYAVSRDGGTAVDGLWMSIPAVLTLGWAYARRDDRLLPTNVLAAIGVATLLQVVVYLAFSAGDPAYAFLPAALLVGMVFCMAIWSGKGF